MNNQPFLNDYFRNTWHRSNGSMDHLEKTGWSLIQRINPGERVIDVGCGANPFKGKIEHLIGFDPAFEQADFQCTIEEFQTNELFDVAFCLGSINFGNVETIEYQIARVISWLKRSSRIYWRCNPGQQDHPSEECKKIDFYPWSIEEHIRLCDKFGFKLMECSWDRNRIYAEWSRRH